MTTQRALGIALVMLLIALPLISFGTLRDQAALWWAGIALLILGGLIPPITRYAVDREAGEDENGDS